MVKIEIRKARKGYECDFSGKSISIGAKYKRVNIKNVGVFHFAMDVTNKDIRSFIDDESDLKKPDDYDHYMDYDDYEIQ